MKISELLTDETKWTQKVLARDSEGRPVRAVDSTAVCWCLSGAIDRCYSDTEYYFNVQDAIRKETGRFSIQVWNDAKKRTFAEVKAVVIKAEQAADNEASGVTRG